MATETQTAPVADTSRSVPELTILNRVSSIPLVSASLQTLHSAISQNSYALQAYSTAHVLTHRAYSFSSPVLSSPYVAPVILRVDGYANKGLDVVEGRFPYPFHASTENVMDDIKHSTEHAKSVATKTIDDKIKAPAFGLAHGIDARLAPLVNQLEIAVHKLHGVESASSDSSSSSEASTGSTDEVQVKRAYRLSLDFKDQIIVLSSEQLKQLQAQSILLQRASETLAHLNATVAEGYANAKGKSKAATDTLLVQLDTIQKSTAQLPAHLQAKLKPVTEGIQATLADLKEAYSKPDAPLSDKLASVQAKVQERTAPLLEHARTVIGAYIEEGKKYLGEKKEQVETAKDEHVNGISSGGH